jgi:iron complex transport system ATP-binding protein
MMESLLEAENISFSYGPRPALRGVSLAPAAGQITSIIGPNGSGKSTLLKCLFGFLSASGTIQWRDKPINQWRRRDLARLVAYLPQSPLHEPGQTVLEVLRLGRAPYWSAFGLESADDETQVRSVATSLGLDDFLNRPMEELSGGQRQRAFIGRCLAQKPTALLLDEPTTFLDLKHQVEVCRLLKTLAGTGLGILIAWHDLNLAAAYSDQMILLENGAVATAGKPTEVLQPEILSRVYGLPIRRMEGPNGIPIVTPEI